MKQKSITFVKYDMIKKIFVFVFFLSISFTQDKLILQQADLLQSSVINNETITQLSGNIIFKKNDTILKSDFATQYEKSPLVKLNNNVVVKKESQTIYCDSLIYNQDSQFFSMYGNVRIDDKQRSMQSNKALLDEKTEQITLIENCQINENDKHTIYGDEIILTFKDDELNNFEILSGGEIFSTNTGYEKKMEGEKEDLVK